MLVAQVPVVQEVQVAGLEDRLARVTVAQGMQALLPVVVAVEEYKGQVTLHQE